ncbi:hypothetical protein H4R19_001395 [Coemansia spiralis]|nr:hypothetical protein H4R19_001395 [Coemansia spiralis]
MSRSQPAARAGSTQRQQGPGSPDSSSTTASADSGAQDAAGSAVDGDQPPRRAAHGPDSTDGSDPDGDRAGAGAAPAKVRKRRRPQQGSQAAALDAASKDGDAADRGPRGGGGYNGGSTKHIPCKFYRHGNCTAGTSCFFSHDVGLISDKAVCKYFVKGTCRYGNKCALLHGPHTDAAPAAPRGQKSSNKAAANGAQSRRATDANGASAPVRGNLRNALGAASAKKERSGDSDAPYSEAATGHASASYNRESSESTGSSAPMSLVQPRGLHGSLDGFAGDSSITGRMPGGAWATSSAASAMRKDRDLRSAAPGGLGPRDRGRLAGPDAGETGVGTGAKSQPIPKPTSSSSLFGGRAIHSGDDGGLSMQESMQIDSLALSHGAGHHSFAGSPFLTSSIPLLDHFKDIARGDAGSSGTSPRGQSFARSPMAGTSGLLLNRHAFTAIDPDALGLDALDADSASGSPRRARYYNSVFPPPQAADPLGGGAHSIPRSNDLFARPLRPGSLLNEPLSPLSALNDGGAAPTGRLRSNSHVLSPPAGRSPGRSPGMDLGPGAASILGAYSLNDAHGVPFSRPRDPAEGSIWGSYVGSDPRASLASLLPIGASLGGPAGGLGRSLFQQGAAAQPHWPPMGGQPALSATAHSSPYVTAVAGSYGEHRSLAPAPPGGLRASLGESPMLGAIGQQRMQKQQPSTGAGAGGLAASFSGFGTGMFGLDAQRAGNNSAHGSSAASDLVDDLFELEQDAPAKTPAAGAGAAASAGPIANSALAPNPQFISMEGFGQMFSGLALGRPENSDRSSDLAAAAGSPRAPGLSAISRPAA